MKSSGMGDNLYVAGFNLSGDTQQLKRVSGSVATLDVTGIDKTAHERIGGLRDGGIDWTAYFNPAAAQAHPVLSVLPTTDVHVMYARGTLLGSPAAAMIAKQASYDPTRPTDGSLTLDVQALANGYGLDWGQLLTAGQRTDTTAVAGTSVDLTDVTTAFGWQAYVQVFSVAGTSVTVTLEDSASAGTGFATLAGGTFTAVAAPGPGVQRLQGARDATVRRYVRAVTNGAFTSAVFAVMFSRCRTAVAF
jgi:predicted secreted protein